VKQWLDAVNRSVFNQQKSPSLPTLPSASLQHTLLLSTARPFIQSRYAAITMNTPSADDAGVGGGRAPASTVSSQFEDDLQRALEVPFCWRFFFALLLGFSSCPLSVSLFDF
jgi:hypothetical protein